MHFLCRSVFSLHDSKTVLEFISKIVGKTVYRQGFRRENLRPRKSKWIVSLTQRKVNCFQSSTWLPRLGLKGRVSRQFIHDARLFKMWIYDAKIFENEDCIHLLP